ncbi:MAG: ATP-dependent zinc metalloprotease FtsH [Planctomycetia bacterium]|nr:ATP-dependent zinc metalloprotease FtsH [Planctomycetia bacterium]
MLQDPGAVFQNVRYVGRSELRGELVTRDPVTDGDKNEPRVQTIPFRTTIRDYDPALPELLDRYVGAGYEVSEDDASLRGIYSLVLYVLFMTFMMGVGFLCIRWMAGGSSPLSFGRSRHKVYAEKDLKVSFADVAGIDEAMAELREVVDFLKSPDKYQALGGRIPKGVLLVGPPGTGKTLLAKAVAGEADVPFFSMSGSDFVEMFVGVGAARVRDLFAQAEARAPCIVFIDELDALGKTRSGNTVGSHDEREQTLNQLLVEMDGFASNRGVIIMAATNRPETLDPALLRPGRFDRTVVVDRPDISGREAILKVHVRLVKVGQDVDLKHVARLTPGSVGADLANLINEAALMAARRGKEAVSMSEMTEAVERMAVGLERKSRIMPEEEKLRTAFHEAGHALVSCVLPNCDPVHKVSIIPRGVGALGYVLSRPEDDRYTMTKSQLDSYIKMALGGTVAEELVFGEIANGATSDLAKVNQTARRMVKEFGMSSLGRIYFRESEGGFLAPGLSLDGPRDYSEQTACAIDREVRKIVDTATEDVRVLLRGRRPALEAVARKLMEREVIDGDELRQLIAAHPPADMPVHHLTNGEQNLN